MFPIGDIEKSEVRRIAEEQNLATAKKKTQQVFVLLAKRNFKEFYHITYQLNLGNVDIKWKKMGQHSGLMYYTIGQRHGLGIGGDGDPWFVVGKNLNDNVLYVEQGFHHDALYSDYLIASDYSFVNPSEIDLEKVLNVQLNSVIAKKILKFMFNAKTRILLE